MIKIIGMSIFTILFIRVLYVEVRDYKKDKSIYNLIRVFVVIFIFIICLIDLIVKIYGYIHRV